MVHKKSNNQSNSIRKNLDNIINSTKKFTTGAITLGVLGTGVAAAQEANNPDTLQNSRFTKKIPYMIIKPGNRYDLIEGSTPNAITYFPVRADYNNFMEDLKNNKINVSYATAQEMYLLMQDIKCSSIFDKIGEPNRTDGEDISKRISLHLGNVEKINTDKGTIYRNGIWTEKETADMGKMLKNMGYDKMWAIILRTSEGYSETEKRYARDDEIMLTLIDIENYIDLDKALRNAKGTDGDAKILGVYVGMGGDYSTNTNRWTPQLNIGGYSGKVSFGVKGGYDEYMKNFHEQFMNGQGNGQTDIYTQKNTQAVQIGPEIGFDISKSIQLCLGAQNNILRTYTTETAEQLNINPFTGEQRFIKTESEPTMNTQNYWTLDPGLKVRVLKWLELQGNIKYDVRNKKFDGCQTSINFRF